MGLSLLSPDIVENGPRGIEHMFEEIGRLTLWNALRIPPDCAHNSPMTTTRETMTTDANGMSATGSRPDATRRARLRMFLYAAANGACVVCGSPTRLDARAGEADRSVILHIVPSGPRRMGWVAGNVVNACESCNDADGGRNLSAYVSRFAMAAVVDAEWPNLSDASLPTVASRNDASDERMARAARRAALGLPY